MNTKIQNQIAVNPLGYKEVKAVPNIMPSSMTIWAKVFILFLLLGFWRVSYGQPMVSDRLQLYSQNNFNNAFWHTPINPLGARIGFNGLQHFTIMNNNPSGWLYFGTQNQTRMFMNEFGLLGLGNALTPFVPQSRLHIYEDLAGSDNYLRLSNFNSTTLGGARMGQNGGGLDFRIEQLENANMQFWVFGNQYMTLNNNGFLGLGNTAFPITDRLHLHDNAGLDNYVRWTSSLAALGGMIGQAVGSSQFQIRQEENDDMQFWTDGNQRITITGGGSVGINTTTPTARFHVDGTARFQNLPILGTPLTNFLAINASGDVYNQTGSLPQAGGPADQTLRWNGTVWQPNSFLTNTLTGVGINTTPAPGIEFHVDGDVRFDNLPTSTLSTNFLTIDGSGNVENQSGSLPQPGSTGDVLYWDGTGWIPAPGSLVHVDPINTFVGINTTGIALPSALNFVGPVTPPFANQMWQNVAPPFPTTTTFSVAGDVSISGNYYGENIFIASDERLKRDITKLSDWKKVLEIQPSTYKFIGQENESFSFGFLAQDVNRVLPELTSLWGNVGSVNYIGFIPFLLQGLQDHEERLNEIALKKLQIEELELRIKKMESEIEAFENKNVQFVQRFEELEKENLNLQNQNQQLENRLTVLEEKFNAICNMPCVQNNQTPKSNGEGTGNGFGQTGTLGQPPVLVQNEPNPFSETTVIRYFLPENSTNTKIEVKNTEGKVVGSFPISQVGHGNITLTSGSLAAGSYYYSLVINNNIIDTKKMVLLN